MMTALLDWIIAKFDRWGLVERGSRLLGYIALAVAVIAPLWLLKGIYDRRVIAAHEAEQERAARQSREWAAEEHIRDDAANSRNEKELHNAIDAAPPGGELSSAARALACERLRRIGRVPEACRPAGGDGNQAAAD